MDEPAEAGAGRVALWSSHPLMLVLVLGLIVDGLAVAGAWPAALSASNVC